MKNIKSIVRIIKHIGYILDKKQKRASVVVFVSMIACSLLELLGVSIIYPFLRFMMDETSMDNRWYLMWIFKFFPSISNTNVIILMGICICLVYFVKNALTVVFSYLQISYSTKINKELSVKMLRSYLLRPYEYFINTHSKIIIRGLNGDVGAVYTIINDGFTIISELFTILLIVVYLVRMDVFIALVSMVCAGLFFVGITAGFKNPMKRLGSQFRGLAAESPGYTYQLVNGIKEITVLDRKEYFIRTYSEFQDKGARIKKRTNLIESLPNRALEVACVFVVMSVLCIRVSQGVDTNTFIPTVGVFGMALFRIMPSMAKLSGRIQDVVYVLPGLDNTYEIMRDADRIEHEYLEDEKRLKLQIGEYDYDAHTFQDSIVVRGVHWKYLNGTEEILKGLSIVIKKGESIGLIGKSGGGKSTLIDILMSLFKPQSGCVEVDGIDIFLMKQRWRRMIGYVPQSIYLIGESIRKNVAFGIPEGEISDDKVWKALTQSQLKEFVDSLPGKLDTLVGEHGVKLSGGQRQRIAIARALYNDPEILILDEATAALDNDTEKAFMDSIEALQGKKTLILVAHRLTTVRNCDRIYEIKDGIAIERDVREVVKGVGK